MTTSQKGGPRPMCLRLKSAPGDQRKAILFKNFLPFVVTWNIAIFNNLVPPRSNIPIFLVTWLHSSEFGSLLLRRFLQ